MKELIIDVAPVPGEKQEEKFPGKLDVPQETVGCAKAGASIAHLHVRDEHLLQTVDTSLFAHDVEQIRRSCPIIIEGSTGGAPEHTLEQRSVSFTVPGVEMGSLNLGSINLWDGVYHNSLDDMLFYAERLQTNRIKPFFCIFDLSHFSYIEKLEKRQLISKPYVIAFVFDIPNSLPYCDKYLDLFLEEMPQDAVWFLVRHHVNGADGLESALERGGHVRVGFEDGPFLSNGKRARSNVELVEDIAAAASKFGRSIATPERTRELFGLPLK